MRKAATITLIALALIGATGYILTFGSGRPISTDLSVVGNGKPAFVLAYENFSPDAGEALNRLRKIRSDYDDRMLFIVADLGTPQGRSFASQFNLVDSQAVFLTGNGEPLQITSIAEDEQELRSRLDAKLMAVQ